MTTERQLFEAATYNEDRMTAWEVWQAARVDLQELREALQTARDQGSAAWDDWLKEKVDAALAKATPEAA